MNTDFKKNRCNTFYNLNRTDVIPHGMFSGRETTRLLVWAVQKVKKIVISNQAVA